MSTMTSSIVNVALPAITAALVTDVQTVQWVVTAFLLMITSILPLAGRFGDLFGRRKVFGLGFIGFITGSALCSIAPSILALIGARLIQALGSAALVSNSFAIITDNFSKEERGRVLGTIGAVVAIGTMTGPALGGILLAALDWHAVFYVNIPLGFLGYLGARCILPPDKIEEDGSKDIDYQGAFFFALMMCSFLLALNFGTKWGWLSYRIIGLFSLSAVFINLFIWQEKRVQHPMLELGLFVNKPFIMGNISGTLSFMALFSNIILLPFFLHDIQHMAPAQIGLVMSVYSLLMFAVAPLSGILSDKIGPYILTTTGLGIMAFGTYLCAGLTSGAGFWNIVIAQALIGIGNGLFQSPNNSSVMSAVQPSQMGVAGGINALSRNLGMVCGTALGVAIFEHQRQALLAGANNPGSIQAFMGGYHDAMLAAAVYAVVALLVSLSRKGYVRVDEK
jgi:EmrB/QacA subfamily drug resistance transporter